MLGFTDSFVCFFMVINRIEDASHSSGGQKFHFTLSWKECWMILIRKWKRLNRCWRRSLVLQRLKLSIISSKKLTISSKGHVINANYIFTLTFICRILLISRYFLTTYSFTTYSYVGVKASWAKTHDWFFKDWNAICSSTLQQSNRIRTIYK